MIDFMTRLFFESVFLLLAVEAAAVAVAIAVHRLRYTAASKRGVWITLAAGVLLLLVQFLVVTDREAIENMVVAMARAAGRGDVGEIERHVDESFADGRKAEFMSHVNNELQRWQIQEPKVGAVRVEVSGDAATVGFRVFCDLRSNEVVQYNVLSRWKLHCVRRPDGWKMDAIPSAKLGPADLTGQGGMDIPLPVR